MKRLYLLIFLFLSGCGVNEITETENSDISVNISENTEIEVDEVSQNAVSENGNINQFQTGSFNLPVFNGECIYSEAEALQELQTLREVKRIMASEWLKHRMEVDKIIRHVRSNSYYVSKT